MLWFTYVSRTIHDVGIKCQLLSDTADSEACDEAIKQLEQIDDDADAVGVKFVKTDEADFAAEYGIESFPAILYFENKQPSVYDGSYNSAS